MSDYRRTSPVEAAILRSFCARTRSYGMAGATLIARNAIAEACEIGACGSRHTIAARLRLWADVLSDAALTMEARNE